MPEERTTALLEEAVQLLRVIAMPQLKETRQAFTASMLSSPKRTKMWDLMDGSRSLSEIGRSVGTSSEAVRLFVAEVKSEWPDAITVSKDKTGAYPRRHI